MTPQIHRHLECERVGIVAGFDALRPQDRVGEAGAAVQILSDGIRQVRVRGGRQTGFIDALEEKFEAGDLILRGLRPRAGSWRNWRRRTWPTHSTPPASIVPTHTAPPKRVVSPRTASGLGAGPITIRHDRRKSIHPDAYIRIGAAIFGRP